MFLPIGDTPNPRNFKPWVNWALIATNVCVFVLVTLPLSGVRPDPDDPALGLYLEMLAQIVPPGTSLRELVDSLSAYDLFVFEHGYKPGLPAVSDLFSSMFMHAGFMHLAGNMLFLWIYGDNVEHRLGRLGYLFAYVISGVAATLGFALVAGGSTTPLVGASGAISGVLGLYFLLFPRNRVKVLVVFFPFLMNVILIPARWVLGFYVLIDNLLPFLSGVQSGVAYGAHLGGFFAGLGMAVAGERMGWKLPGREGHAPLPPRTADNVYTRKHQFSPGPPQAGAPVQLSGLRSAIAADQLEPALIALSRLNQHELAALTIDEHVVLADWLNQAGFPTAALRMLRRGLLRTTRPQERAQLHLALGHLRLAQGQSTAAYQHLLDALDQDPSDETKRAAREALEGIDVYKKKEKAVDSET
ncbi:MAG TPA: hypothetical protein DIU15_17640 [Deltaproteobacteria bacterium]|nr:hypothetical protein [Deltaproteobacteria bacterium]